MACQAATQTGASEGALTRIQASSRRTALRRRLACLLRAHRRNARSTAYRLALPPETQCWQRLAKTLEPQRQWHHLRAANTAARRAIALALRRAAPPRCGRLQNRAAARCMYLEA